MRTVVMDENSRLVNAVIRIPSEVLAAINDRAFPTRGGESLGDHKSGKTGANDQKVSGSVRLHDALKLVIVRPRFQYQCSLQQDAFRQHVFKSLSLLYFWCNMMESHAHFKFIPVYSISHYLVSAYYIIHVYVLVMS